MNYAKVVTGGIAGWLDFERACDRSGLFSEKYLTSAVGQILSARSGNRVEAEFTHPVLAPLATGRGRRPEIDFVVRDEDRKIKLAAETKWADGSIPSIESIIWDLIRLELLAHHENAKCLFILAGTSSKLKKIFEHPLFSDQATKPHRRPVLRHDNNVRHSMPLVPIVPERFAMMKRLFTPYPDFRFPEKITTIRTAPMPNIVKPKEYQVFTWEVTTRTNRREFKPSSSKYFN